MNDNPLSTTEAVNLILRSFSVTGSEAELTRIARACACREPILRLAIEILTSVGGDASRFFDDDVQMAMASRLDLTNDRQLLDAYFMGSAYHLSNFEMLGLHRGEYQRGLQLIDVFERVGVPRHVLPAGVPMNDDYTARDYLQALYALERGDLNTAEVTFRRLGFEPLPEQDYRSRYPALYAYAARQNFIDALILRGTLLEAEQIADTMTLAYEAEGRDVINDEGQRQRYGYISLETAVAAFGEASGSNPYARRALIRTLRGDVSSALSDFKAAERFQHFVLKRWYGSPLKALAEARARYPNDRERWKEAIERANEPVKFPPPALTGQAALYYGVLLTRLGKLRSALNVIDYNRRWAQHYRFRPMTARAHVYQSDVHRLMGDHEQAARYLELPLTWAAEAGHAEIHTLALLAKARLHLAQNELDQARSAAEEAHALAESHGFTLLRIDALVTRGHILFQEGKVEEARSLGRDALEFAHPIECGYAWGHASALHLIGMTHHAHRDARFVENALYATYGYRVLRGAADIRERIRDPRLANTMSLLGDLPVPEEDR